MSATTKTWVNGAAPTCEDADLNGFKSENNNLILGSGQALNVGDNQQTHKAVAAYAAGGNFYTGGGTANAQTLSLIGSRVTPEAYFEGMAARWVPSVSNTGAATIAVGALGTKSLLDSSGNALSSGAVVAGQLTEAFYDGTAFRLYASAYGDAVAGYVQSKNFYLGSALGGIDLGDPSTFLTSTFETFGPTGSGADNIIAAMDSIPLAAKYVQIKSRLYASILSGTASGQFSASLYASPNLSPSLTPIQRVSTFDVTHVTGNASTVDTIGTSLVPLTAANQFSMAWVVSGTADSYLEDCKIMGFGV